MTVLLEYKLIVVQLTMRARCLSSIGAAQWALIAWRCPDVSEKMMPNSQKGELLGMS